MTADFQDITFDDIQKELEADSRPAGVRAAARVAEFFAREVPPDAGRRPRVRTRSDEENGHGLIGRCGDLARKRYHTLLHFEPGFPEGGDYSYLIGPVCQLVEGELCRLLAQPACDAVWPHLVAALQVRKDDRRQGTSLEAWKAQRLPITLGTQCLVLLALRRGCEHGLEPIRAFLAETFKTGYESLLKGKKVEGRLNVLRDRYRNPIAHGKEIAFDREGYEECVQLAVANRTFSAWDARGPEFRAPDPRAQVGLLHHHLSLRLGLSEPRP